MKKITFICQSKGGTGKSVLAFLMASKYHDAIVLDMDDATQTTMMQLAYRSPALVSFLNENKSIDRGLFSDFIEHISTHEKDHFICDLGASISEQLPEYFRDIDPGNLKELLTTEYNIELELICVIAGGNMFTSSVRYLRNLVKAIDHQFRVTVACNEYFYMDNEQKQLLEEVLKEDGAKKTPLLSAPFTIATDKNISTQDRIREVLKSGKGIAGASAFSKLYFNKAVKNLQF